MYQRRCDAMSGQTPPIKYGSAVLESFPIPSRANTSPQVEHLKPTNFPHPS